MAWYWIVLIALVGGTLLFAAGAFICFWLVCTYLPRFGQRK